MWIQDHLITIIGVAASIGTGTSLVPQLVKLIQTKKGSDISKGMLALLLTGLILWVVYGILKKDWIIIISNAFSILINIAITVLSVIYKKKGTNEHYQETDQGL